MSKGYCDIPMRSALYNLEPLEIGTPFVESLTSYISRLAGNHMVSTGMLVKSLLIGEILRLYPNSELDSNLFYSRKSVNRFGEFSEQCVAALQNLTGRQDLRYLTLCKWEGFFHNPKALHSHMRWCPECYDSWRMNNSTIYNPLLWSIKSVEVCSVHKVELSSICPNCNKTPRQLAEKSRIGYCTVCLTWLGGDAKKIDLTNQGFRWKLFLVEQIGELLSNNSKQESCLTKDEIYNSLVKLIRITTGNPHLFAKHIKSGYTNVSNWFKGRTFPEAESIIKICKIYDISLIEWMFGRLDYNSIYINPKAIVPVTKRRNNLSPTLFEENLKQLKKIYESEFPPPSISTIKKRLKDSRLEEKFPDICEKMSIKYKKYVKGKGGTKAKCEEVERVIMSLYRQNITPTYQKIREQLGNPGILRNPKVRETWQRTVEKLNI